MGSTSRRTVRERYDVPAPQPLDADDAVGAVRLPRSGTGQSSRLTARVKGRLG